MKARNITYQELELQRQELSQRRKLIEQKLQEQTKLAKEFEETEKKSHQRLIHLYHEQYLKAQQRNQSYLEEISLLTSNVQFQKDLLKIKHQSSSSNVPNSSSSLSSFSSPLTGSSSYLLKAKKNYELHYENLLPFYYREQTQQMEHQYKQLQLTKTQSNYRFQLLRKELAKEQEMKKRLYQQKQEVLQLLTMEQREIMESKIHHLLLQEENQLVEKELQQYILNEGYRLENQAKEELNHFHAQEALSLPMNTTVTSSFNDQQTQKRLLPNEDSRKIGGDASATNAVPLDTKIDQSSAPAELIDKPFPSPKKDSRNQLADLKRNALLSVKQNQSYQKSLNESKDIIIIDDPRTVPSTLAPSEKPPSMIDRPAFNKLSNDLSAQKEGSSLSIPINTLSEEQFFMISTSNTTSRNPSPQHHHSLINRADSAEFGHSISVKADMIYPTKGSSALVESGRHEVISPPVKESVAINQSGKISGSDSEFDVVEEKSSSISQNTEIASLNNLQSAVLSNSKATASLPEKELIQVDVSKLSIDLLNKILNKSYQYIESQLSSLSILKSLYEWGNGISTSQTGLRLLKQLQDSIDMVSNEFWEEQGIIGSNIKPVGELVLYIISEKGSTLIPSHVLEGVVTMEKVRRELKKTNGLLMLFDNTINHLKLLISVKPSWLDDLTSCFTAAFVKHVSSESYDRMNRKILKLLQLGILPEETESSNNPSIAASPYRRSTTVSSTPTFSVNPDANWASTSVNVDSEDPNPVAITVGKRKSVPTSAATAIGIEKYDTSRVAELEVDEIVDDEEYEKPPALKDLDREKRSERSTKDDIKPLSSSRAKPVLIASKSKRIPKSDVDEFDF